MNDRLATYLRKLAAEGFYGNVSLKLDAGRVVLLSVQQSIKPENLPCAERSHEDKPWNEKPNTTR